MKEINKRSLYQSCKRKVRYRDTAEVLKALRKCKQKRGDELDYYYCDYCHGYHLTSKMEFDFYGTSNNKY